MYCDTAAYNTLVVGMRAREQSDVLDFGSRVHLFAKNLHEHKNPLNWWQGVLHERLPQETQQILTATCIGLSKYPLPVAQVVERYYRTPFYEEVHDDAIWQVDMCGTMDRISWSPAEGIITILDYKTTRRWNLRDVLDEYLVSTQFPFYANALRRLPKLLPDPAAQEAARLGRIQVKVLAIKIARLDKEGTIQPPEFAITAPMYWSIAELDHYEHLLSQYASGLIHTARTKRTTKSGYAANQCPECEYAPICHARSPEAADAVARNYFITEPYDPSQFGKPRDLD